ncbi:MAG: tyrosine-protein phosphatase [Tractidigestivibacter sp.]|jgi:protein-tyrosine phosphatase|uniref:tyrosine-protein phosphatase n=1 Tax=Tractidigestivibacter sp. TaxID=2847320 RepID=UPI003D9315BA
MHDIHCHILPGVDDGARTMEDSLAMLEAAKAAGVTEITCTPHCRDPYFDFNAMWQAFYDFQDAAGDFPVHMGFEVNHRKLMELGLDWARVLACDGTANFLLELSVNASPSRFADYERTIFELQGMGYHIIIAHPERYVAIQRDISIAQELVDMGCELQASADFIEGGRLGAEKRPAIKMLKQGLYSYIASDAHNVKHYRCLEHAINKYAKYLG